MYRPLLDPITTAALKNLQTRSDLVVRYPQLPSEEEQLSFYNSIHYGYPIPTVYYFQTRNVEIFGLTPSEKQTEVKIVVAGGAYLCMLNNIFTSDEFYFNLASDGIVKHKHSEDCFPLSVLASSDFEMYWQLLDENKKRWETSGLLVRLLAARECWSRVNWPETGIRSNTPEGWHNWNLFSRTLLKFDSPQKKKNVENKRLSFPELDEIPVLLEKV